MITLKHVNNDCYQEETWINIIDNSFIKKNNDIHNSYTNFRFFINVKI